MTDLQSFGLKMMPRVSTLRSNRSKYIFFPKGGAFGGAILSKRCHFAVSECDPHLSQNLWEAYLLSQKQNFGLKMMPRVSP